MLRNRVIPAYGKIVEGRDPVPVFLMDDPVYPLLPFLIKQFSAGRRNERENFCSYKLSSACIPIE